MQQGPPGFEENASPEILLLIGFCILMLGFVLGFAGRVAWRHIMSFIGALIGGLLGFVYGTAIGGWIVGLLVSMLGAIIGSVIFVFLATVGLGAVAGILTYVVSMSVVDNFLFSAIAAGIAFVVTIAFADEAIGVVTAVVGGLLVGIGLIWIDVTNMTIVVLAMFGTMILGSAFQLSVIKEERERRTRAVTGPVAPVAPPVAGHICPTCSGTMTYIPEYNRYYCYRCQHYD
jgi:hypothetical protein